MPLAHGRRDDRVRPPGLGIVLVVEHDLGKGADPRVRSTPADPLVQLHALGRRRDVPHRHVHVLARTAQVQARELEDGLLLPLLHLLVVVGRARQILAVRVVAQVVRLAVVGADVDDVLGVEVHADRDAFVLLREEERRGAVQGLQAGAQRDFDGFHGKIASGEMGFL